MYITYSRKESRAAVATASALLSLDCAATRARARGSLVSFPERSRDASAAAAAADLDEARDPDRCFHSTLARSRTSSYRGPCLSFFFLFLSSIYRWRDLGCLIVWKL